MQLLSNGSTHTSFLGGLEDGSSATAARSAAAQALATLGRACPEGRRSSAQSLPRGSKQQKRHYFSTGVNLIQTRAAGVENPVAAHLCTHLDVHAAAARVLGGLTAMHWAMHARSAAASGAAQPGDLPAAVLEKLLHALAAPASAVSATGASAVGANLSLGACVHGTCHGTAETLLTQRDMLCAGLRVYDEAQPYYQQMQAHAASLQLLLSGTASDAAALSALTPQAAGAMAAAVTAEQVTASVQVARCAAGPVWQRGCCSSHGGAPAQQGVGRAGRSHCPGVVSTSKTPCGCVISSKFHRVSRRVEPHGRAIRTEPFL